MIPPLTIVGISPHVIVQRSFNLFKPIRGMSDFSDSSMSCNGVAISESEILEATEFSKTLGAILVLKLTMVGAEILKSGITLIRITSIRAQINPIWIAPTWITLIWFLPTCQTIICPTFGHYNKYCHGTKWTQNTVLFLQKHLQYILTHHRYIQPLWYIHTIRYLIHVTHKYLLMYQVTLNHHCMILHNHYQEWHLKVILCHTKINPTPYWTYQMTLIQIQVCQIIFR